jgi:hypothetical protein
VVSEANRIGREKPRMMRFPLVTASYESCLGDKRQGIPFLTYQKGDNMAQEGIQYISDEGIPFEVVREKLGI